MNIIRVLFGLLLLTVAASAQVANPPARGRLLPSGVFYIPGITTTNIPSTLAPTFSPGAFGFSATFDVGATNAASTTNMTVTLEGTVDGSNWIDAPTSAFPVLSVPQNGTSPYTYFTNVPATSVNIGNVYAYRIKSIQNTNVLGIFITNAFWATR